MSTRSPRRRPVFACLCVLALTLATFALTSCATGPAGTTETGTSETETETETGGEPPLSNGPGGAAVMTLGCAPDDGGAWVLTIGHGDACDAGAPDPSQPYVRITNYDSALLGDPVGATSTWTDWQLGQAQYAPEGSAGTVEAVSAGTLHIATWDAVGEVGSTLTGWYTLTLADQTEVGAAFEATFCGGDPMCG